MWKLWLTLAAFVALPFGMMGIHNVYEHHVEKRDMEYVESMKLEPWAVGRYLIDVPRGAEVHYAQGYRGAGADVEVFPCTLSQARGLVQDRVEELRGTEHLLGGTLLEKYVKSRTLPNTWILYRWQSRTYKSDDLQAFMDAYHWMKQTGSRSSLKEDSCLFKFGCGTNINESVMRQDQAEIEAMFRLVRIRDNREIPTEPGFCMGYSFIPGEAPEGIHGEGASITFAVPGHPDIFVRYETQLVSPTTASGQKLLDRMKDVDSDPMFTALTIDILRAKERSVGSLQGQEYLKMIKEKGVWNMQFLWEFNGVGESWEKPAMSLELINTREKGSRTPLSMTKEEAMALWDAMVDSIRLRSTTKAPAAPGSGIPGASLSGRDPAPKPRAALGTRLRSGERCTQTGIWACSHEGNRLGATRAFQEGEELPAAVLDVPRGWFDKLMRRPSEIVVDTVWTLAGYPEGVFRDQPTMGSPASPS